MSGETDPNEQAIWVDCRVAGCPTPRQACRVGQVSAIFLEDQTVTVEADLRSVKGCPNAACGTEVARGTYIASTETQLLTMLIASTVTVVDLHNR